MAKQNIFNKYLVIEDISEQPKPTESNCNHTDQVSEDFDNFFDACEYMQKMRYSQPDRKFNLVGTIAWKIDYTDVSSIYSKSDEAQGEL